MIGKVTVTINMARLEQLMRKIPDKAVRILHDGVDYGIYQEFGTTKMAAHPFMTPAAEAVRQPFLDGLKVLHNIEDIDTFTDKVAHDAEAIAKTYVAVDTGRLKNSITVSKPEALGL